MEIPWTDGSFFAERENSFQSRINQSFECVFYWGVVLAWGSCGLLEESCVFDSQRWDCVALQDQLCGAWCNRSDGRMMRWRTVSLGGENQASMAGNEEMVLYNEKRRLSLSQWASFPSKHNVISHMFYPKNVCMEVICISEIFMLHKKCSWFKYEWALITESDTSVIFCLK